MLFRSHARAPADKRPTNADTHTHTSRKKPATQPNMAEKPRRRAQAHRSPSIRRYLRFGPFGRSRRMAALLMITAAVRGLGSGWSPPPTSTFYSSTGILPLLFSLPLPLILFWAASSTQASAPSRFQEEGFFSATCSRIINISGSNQSSFSSTHLVSTPKWEIILIVLLLWNWSERLACTAG